MSAQMEKEWDEVAERNPFSRRDQQRSNASDIFHQDNILEEDSDEEEEMMLERVPPLGQPSQLEEPHPPTPPPVTTARRGYAQLSDRDLLEASSSNPGGGDCYNLWMEKNRCPKTLMAMALGLKEPNGRLLADFEDDVRYKNMTGRSNFNPTVEILKMEMKRRAAKECTKHKKNSAPKTECLRWLKRNPVKDEKDVAFLVKEEGKIYAMVAKAAMEEEQLRIEKQSNANWTGACPWLRLYGAMSSDEAKQALAHFNSTLSREELDARNSIEKPETYPEVVCRIWNDVNFVYVTETIPDLHEEFSEAITLKFEDMPGGTITVEDVKRKMTQVRAKLVQVSTELPNASLSTLRFPFYSSRVA